MAFVKELLARSEHAISNGVDIWIFRAGSIAALIVVMFAAFKTVVLKGQTDPGTIAWFAGSGGAFVLTGISTTLFLRGQLQTLRKIMFHVVGIGGGDE